MIREAMQRKQAAGKPKPAADHVAAAAKALTDLDNLLSAVEREKQDADDAVRRAQQALAEAESRQRFVAAKISRVGAAVAAPLRQAAAAKPWDEKLKGLLARCKQAPWAKLARDGATDEQILTILKTGWPEYPGHKPTRARGGYYEAEVWIDNTGHKPTLAGKALAAEVRRLMNIPQPKPKAPAKPAAKKPAAAAAAKPDPKKGGGGAGGGGSGSASAPAAKKPAKKPAAPAEAPASAAAGDGGDDDDGPVESIEPGETYKPGQVGLAGVDLEAHFPPDLTGGANGPDTSPGGRIGAPVELSDGETWAVVTAASKGGTTYALQPVYREAEWAAPAQTWAVRRAGYAQRAPEDVPLGGVKVQDPAGGWWVLGPDAERIYCAVPGQPKVLGDPSAWRAAPADDADAGVTPADVAAGGVADIRFTTLPDTLGRARLLVHKDAAGWWGGYDIDLSPAGLGKVRQEPGGGLLDPRDSRQTAAAAALDELVKLCGRSLKAKRKDLGKAGKLDDAEAVGRHVEAFRGKLDAQQVAQDCPLGTPAWAKYLGFGDVSEERARTIAALPEDRRHLMKDKRVQDDGRYLPGDVESVLLDSVFAVGDVSAYVTADGDGRWHVGHYLYWTRATLGHSRTVPRVDGPTYPSRSEALNAAAAQALVEAKSIDRSPPHTTLDVEHAGRMARALEDWLRRQGAADAPPAAAAGKPAGDMPHKVPGQKQTYRQWLSGVRASLAAGGLGHDARADDADPDLWAAFRRGTTARAAAADLRTRGVRAKAAGPAKPTAAGTPKPNGAPPGPLQVGYQVPPAAAGAAASAAVH